MSDRLSRGKLGEDITADYLCKNDFEVVARNYHSRYGEIDIIAEKKGCISFIEVKTRASTRFGRPIEAVTLAKQRKIHRCAEYYLQCNGLLERPPVLSFDVVEIIIEGTAAISINHWPHCF